MDQNPRKQRLIELTKKANRTPVEETERAALAAEFPEGVDTSEKKQVNPSTKK